MKCHAAQRRLLEAEDPAGPAAEVHDHLAACPSCRDWQRRLLQIERHVSLLPVPLGSGPPADLLQRLERGPIARPAPRPLLRAWPPFLGRPSARRAAGIAAAVLAVAALGWWNFRGSPEQQVAGPVTPRKTAPDVDPLVKKLLQRDLKLAKTRTADESLEQLAYLAEDLHDETRKLADAAGTDDLQQLASLYKHIIDNGVLVRAEKDFRNLTRRDRDKIFSRLAARLAQEEKQARQRAEEVPAASGPLLALADAARDGQGKLQKLIKGESP